MAAPTLSKGEAKLTLGEKVKQKQKKNIKKHKNVLFNPFPYKWPKLDTYFECKILDELQALLTSLPLKLPKRPASYFKNGAKESRKNKQTSDSRKQSSANGSSCQTPGKERPVDEGNKGHLQLINKGKQPTDDCQQMTHDGQEVTDDKAATAKEQITRASEVQDERVKEMRSLMVCGVRCVTKGLEKDDLELIIVCRSTKPSIITSHLIPLAASRGCPALSVPDFSKTIAPLLGVSSLVVLGFKKVPDGIQSEFAEFVRYSRSVSLPLDSPLTNQALGMPPVQDTTQTLNDDEKSTDTIDTEDESESVSDKAADASAKEELESGDRREDVESRDLSGGSENKSESGATLDTSSLVEKSAKDLSGFLSLDTPSAKNCEYSGVVSLTSTSVKRKADPISVSQDSPAHKDNVQCKRRGTSLEFPLNGPAPFVPKEDYSHLYVFKVAGKFGDDFVPFGGAKSKKRSLVTEEGESEPKPGNALGMEDLPNAKRSKQTRSVRNVDGYVPAVIKHQIPNANKKRKRTK